MVSLSEKVEGLQKSLGTAQRVLSLALLRLDGSIDISEEELVDDTVSYVISSEKNEEENKITLSVTKFDSSGKTV